MTELDKYIGELDALLQKLKPAQRSRLSRRLAVEMRQRNAERIRANIQPDGRAMQQRSGDRWQMRPLKPGETIRRGQLFNHFHRRHIRLDWVRDRGDRVVGGISGGEASGYIKDHIYLPYQSLKQKMMFKKMPKTRHLKIKNDANQAAIGFMGSIVGRIAAEHQYGAAKLPARELLGFSNDDLAFIRQAVWEALASGG